MIAVHLEPKGLDRDTPALADFVTVANRRAEASVGSARLRDAILIAKGITPPKPILVPPLFKPRSSRGPGRPKGHRKTRRPNAKIAHIQAIVAGHFEITVDAMLKPCKRHDISHPRQIAMYASRKKTTASYPDIGIQFGGMDHATVIHAFRQIEKRVAEGDAKTIEALLVVHKALGA